MTIIIGITNGYHKGDIRLHKAFKAVSIYCEIEEAEAFDIQGALKITLKCTVEWVLMVSIIHSIYVLDSLYIDFE